MTAIVNPRGPRMRPGHGSADIWLRNATRDEVLFAARVAVLVAHHRSETDLARLALALRLVSTWGEEPNALRERILWRSRWHYRTLPPSPEPPTVLRWWARAVNRLPVSWREPARRLVDWCRRTR